MKYLIALFFTLISFLPVAAQITGKVTDAETGETLPYVRVSYNAKQITRSTDINGRYSIQRIEGADLSFSIVGYRTQTFRIKANTQDRLNVVLEPISSEINEVVVKGKGVKYRKKNNPAVELMERIIAANKRNNLKSNPYYEYYRYQKLICARNNVDSTLIDSLRRAGSKEWMTDQVEFCPMNNRLILPMQTNESVVRTIYRKDHDDERNITLGENKNGFMTQMSVLGEYYNAAVEECFVDVDVFDDQVKLLQQGFLSPIAKTATSFYHYYINDTVMVGNDRCYDLYFAPANHQDVGFSGHLYALADSSLHLRRLELSLPKGSGVNFVKNMVLNQEFVKLPDGQWVLDSDDMLAELYLNNMLKDMVMIRRIKYSDYSFNNIPHSQFRGKAAVTTVPEASSRPDGFWNKFRTIELSHAEKHVNKFAQNFMNQKGLKWLFLALKVYSEDYIRMNYKQDAPSYFEVGPITTLIGKNFYDGWRGRISARTTPQLCHHFFWNGYIAQGTQDTPIFNAQTGQLINTDQAWKHKIYYQSRFIYSFNRKNKQPWEFPIRQVQFETSYDLRGPSDDFLSTNKDNWLNLIPLPGKPGQTIRYINRRQKLSFTWETAGGLALNAAYKHDRTQGIYRNKDSESAVYNKVCEMFILNDGNGTPYPGRYLTTSEFSVGLRYAPGETYINTNLARYPTTQNAPVFYFGHTVGLKNFLGGQYNSNVTEISFTKRLWLRSWGKMDFFVAGRAQWNRVPMPGLIVPTTNPTWFLDPQSHTFNLMRDMEFLNDRVAQWEWRWNLNGKLFNRIPLIKKLKWREMISFRGMWGHLSSRNDPNNMQGDLFMFPYGVHGMNKTHVGDHGQMSNMPYMEAAVGIHNIFKFFEIDYIHRLTYLNKNSNNIASMNWGIRVGLNFSF